MLYYSTEYIRRADYLQPPPTTITGGGGERRRYEKAIETFVYSQFVNRHRNNCRRRRQRRHATHRPSQLRTEFGECLAVGKRAHTVASSVPPCWTNRGFRYGTTAASGLDQTVADTVTSIWNSGNFTHPINQSINKFSHNAD